MVPNSEHSNLKYQEYIALAGLVGWVLTCEPKGYWFNSQSGHMPGLWARSPVGGIRETTNYILMFLSLSPSLALSLKKYINKLIF